ncbi:hypothetical protein [Anaerococcus kampingiae]|uniref:hypothetical protein n=1 Tax=Anaerococcus kampingae TaxID=3115614 RepID=UPI003967213F
MPNGVACSQQQTKNTNPQILKLEKTQGQQSTNIQNRIKTQEQQSTNIQNWNNPKTTIHKYQKWKNGRQSPQNQ